MNTSQAVSDPRTTFRLLGAAINGAILVTLLTYTSIPEPVVAAWATVLQAALGFGEVLFDHRGSV